MIGVNGVIVAAGIGAAGVTGVVDIGVRVLICSRHFFIILLR